MPIGTKEYDGPMNSKTNTTVEAVTSGVSDLGIFEMIHRPEEKRTTFCAYQNGELSYLDRVTESGSVFVPYSAKNNLIRNEVVLFPSEAVDYGSDVELINEIQAFLHRYVDISTGFEKICSYYVLFTWLYDNFNELPYLRVRGDMGSGKTRFLLIIGSLCYKSIFASGASSVSPLFRIIDAIRGTLIIDEGDFRFSDEKTEIIKILNNGNARGFPVLRSEADNARKEFSPKAFQVFGPKIVATRGYFQDRALESRCLTEELGSRRLRKDIPINLTSDYKDAARIIRNKLLMFRFRNYGRRMIDPSLFERSLEPRLAQIFCPLLTLIDDPAVKTEVEEIAQLYQKDLVADRSLDLEALVLGIINELKTASIPVELSIREITDRFASRHSSEIDRKITPHWMGFLIRRKLRLKTEKRHGVYFIATSESSRLLQLFEKYGIVDSNSGGSGDFIQTGMPESPPETMLEKEDE